MGIVLSFFRNSRRKIANINLDFLEGRRDLLVLPHLSTFSQEQLHFHLLPHLRWTGEATLRAEREGYSPARGNGGGAGVSLPARF